DEALASELRRCEQFGKVGALPTSGVPSVIKPNFNTKDPADVADKNVGFCLKPPLVLSAGQSVVGEASDQETKPYEWTIIFRASLAGEPQEHSVRLCFK